GDPRAHTERKAILDRRGLGWRRNPRRPMALRQPRSLLLQIAKFLRLLIQDSNKFLEVGPRADWGKIFVLLHAAEAARGFEESSLASRFYHYVRRSPANCLTTRKNCRQLCVLG